ncbi:MAG TPA: lactate utilization protein [Desulfatiglandales bacterium]|nr:lactate utilization protein [Desulfatiglandales bacterium]
MNLQVERTLAALHGRHIRGVFAKNCDEGREKVLGLISVDAIVGIGDSTAIRQMGLPRALRERGTRILDAFDPQGEKMHPKDAREKHAKIIKEATITDVFLTGTNAITEDGILVNVDAVGNRVAGIVWGHPLSIVVVGRNKIVRDLHEAFQRVRNIIAPNHARIRSAELGGGKMKTPCAKTGECTDCRSIDRICNVFTIIEGKPFRTQLTVLIVNEDLGLSWDTSWPQSRVSGIIEEYKKFVWIPPRNDF